MIAYAVLDRDAGIRSAGPSRRAEMSRGRHLAEAVDQRSAADKRGARTRRIGGAST